MLFISSHELVIGCSGWSQRAFEPEKDAAKLTAMYVHERCVRRGVVKALLEACKRGAREKGLKRMEFIATLAGIEFYKRMGYEIMDKKDGKEGSKFKESGDGLLIEFKEMGKNLG
jgi:N-acetylglutamate synthase-like GNAT family acetyltransferase